MCYLKVSKCIKCCSSFGPFTCIYRKKKKRILHLFCFVRFYKLHLMILSKTHKSIISIYLFIKVISGKLWKWQFKTSGSLLQLANLKKKSTRSCAMHFYPKVPKVFLLCFIYFISSLREDLCWFESSCNDLKEPVKFKMHVWNISVFYILYYPDNIRCSYLCLKLYIFK